MRKCVGGQVPYNIQGWLDKNKDPIQECVVQLMADAKEPLVSLFFKDPEDGGNVRPESVIRPVHRHRIDKYLDTLLANQPILDVEATDHCKNGAPQDGGLPS